MSDNNHQIPLKSTLIDNDSRETIVAKYLDDNHEVKYIASQDNGITCSYMNSNRSLVEIFIREYQSRYEGKLKLHKLIRYPSYSQDWNDLFRAIQSIQNRRLNIAIEYDPGKMIHFARVYDVVGKDKSPLLALFNALLQWIHRNSTTMGMFEDIDFVRQEKLADVSPISILDL